MNPEILNYLKINGEQLDSVIAEALNMPIAHLKSQVSQLTLSGDVICCNVTRFTDGKKIEGVSCRLSCYTPPPARGRKPGVKRAPGGDITSI